MYSNSDAARFAGARTGGTITHTTWQPILSRQREGGGMEPAARESLRKDIKRSARRDTRAWLLEGTGADSSDKHRWNTIRNLKRVCAPSHWERPDSHGAPVPKQQKAAAAARCLATQHWCDSDDDEAPPVVDG